MKTTKEILLEMAISDLILEVAYINQDDITTSDLQGTAHAKAIEIIKLVRE
jgi:hypothetical protein